jgi:hypothetical protein
VAEQDGATDTKTNKTTLFNNFFNFFFIKTPRKQHHEQYYKKSTIQTQHFFFAGPFIQRAPLNPSQHSICQPTCPPSESGRPIGHIGRANLPQWDLLFKERPSILHNTQFVNQYVLRSKAERQLINTKLSPGDSNPFRTTTFANNVRNSRGMPIEHISRANLPQVNPRIQYYFF